MSDRRSESRDAAADSRKQSQFRVVFAIDLGDRQLECYLGDPINFLRNLTRNPRSDALRIRADFRGQNEAQSSEGHFSY